MSWYVSTMLLNSLSKKLLGHSSWVEHVCWFNFLHCLSLPVVKLTADLYNLATKCPLKYMLYLIDISLFLYLLGSCKLDGLHNLIWLLKLGGELHQKLLYVWHLLICLKELFRNLTTSLYHLEDSHSLLHR